MSTTWTSSASGFLKRDSAYRYPLPPGSFDPPRSALDFAVLKNAPADPEGFTLAIFSPVAPESRGHFAVDSKGHVFVINEADASKLILLTKEVTTLPATGNFRNTWILKKEVTSRPIERILVPRNGRLLDSPADNYEDEYYEVSVQGFNYQERRLKDPVQGEELLPSSLWELTGLILEGANSSEGYRPDEVVLARVKAVLGNVF